MLSSDKTFEYDVAEYMLTRFVDYITATRPYVFLVILPSGKKDKIQILTRDRVTDLIKDFASYIDNQLNNPTPDYPFKDLDKHMSSRFKNH